MTQYSSQDLPGGGEPIDGDNIGEWLESISTRVQRIEREYSGPHSPRTVVACSSTAQFPTPRANMWALRVANPVLNQTDDWYESQFNQGLGDWEWVNVVGPPPEPT